MIIIADTKPRFRAEFMTAGPGNRWRRKADELYTSWEKGPLLPNSVVAPLDEEEAFKSMFKRPGEIVILQSGDERDWRTMLRIIRKFIQMNPNRRERLIVVDEILDFYGRNTFGIDGHNDPLLHAARAGGERGIGSMYGAHRTRGVPPMLNMLSSRVILFRLRYERDLQYLYEMGVSEDEEMPEDPYVFKHFTIEPGGKVSQPLIVRLKYPQWYLDQLSAS